MKKKITLMTFVAIAVFAAYFFFIARSPTKIHPNFFQSIDINQSEDFEARVTRAVYNERKALLALGYESGEIEIYDGKRATKYMSIHPYDYRSDILCFSKSGNYLSTGSYFEDATKIYDLEEKSLLITLNDTRGPELFTSNGNYLILANDSAIKLYDIKNDVWIDAYETDGVVQSLSFNDDETFLAVGTTGKIQLFSCRIDNDATATLALVKTVEAYGLKNWILYSWFVGDNLVTLSRFANLDVWSIPDLNEIRTIPLNSKTVSDAVLGTQKRYLMVLGVNNAREKGRFFAEQVDLKVNTSKILAKITTNLPNIAKWPPSLAPKGNELVFVVHSRKKMLLRLGQVPEIEIKANFQADLTKYLEIPIYYKALAVAQASSRQYAGSFISNQPSQLIANQKALEACQKHARKKDLKAECTIILQGDSLAGN